MCGIYGIVGKINTKELLDNLAKLEYRGYDSCGIVYIYKNKSFVYKTIGNTSKLKDIVDYRAFDIAIGHTRWATHGCVTAINAHPHTSNNSRFYIVHNGVIDNYLDLIKKYSFNLLSDTDSEVIVHLLDMFSKKYSIVECLKLISIELVGSYAIVILDKETPDKLYFIKNRSPLLLAIDNSKIVLASDQIAFDNKMNVTIINDNNYGYISNNNYQIYTFNDNEKWNTFYKDSSTEIKKVNKYYMLDEILYQSKMIRDIANNYSKIDVRDFIKLLYENKEIVFVGAGSSYYAGCILSKYYENKLKKRCYSVIASELKYFNLFSSNILFIFISQSGETADLIEGLLYLKEKQYRIVSLCNNVNSTLGYKSDIIFPLFAKEEIAVASTKALVSTIYVGKLLLNKETYCKKAFWLSNSIDYVVSNWNKLEEISSVIAKAKNIFYLGKDIDYFICLEGALKLREISYLNSFAFQSGELKHGSISLIDNQCVCIGILTNLERENALKNNLEEVRSRGSKVFLFSNCCDCDLYVNGDEIGIIVALQIIAYQVALRLNRNIDQPRNLAKSVTVL